jgi:DNA-directed RNA polymerase specialized sigma24 family protein
MRRKKVLLQSLIALLLLWGVVAAVRAIAGSRQITAEKVGKAVDAAAFEDWSAQDSPPDAAKAKQREEKLREVAGLVNRLDFAEREKTRDDRSTERLFRRMSPDEKKLFIDLTVRESMGKFMQAIDQLPPEKRKEFVERGLREIESGKTGEEMARAQELGQDLLETITSEGMRAYFEKASADTKLDLAPLMESMNEVMQGLRGQEFGPGSR